MFTKEFSHAPTYAQGGHVFFGGTAYSVRGALRLPLVWRKVLRRMRSSPGYKGHFVWYRFPFTFGNWSLWDSRAEMMRFARSQEHLDAVAWMTSPGVARASFIRFLRADDTGHTIGEWRAEDDGEAWRSFKLPFSETAEGSVAR